MAPKSVMTHNFSDVPKAEIPRSSFDRSHGYKTTFDVGRLVPFYCDEALPGDTFNLKTTAFARLATPIKPIMDNMFMETFFFSVPVRQIWENWEKFNGEQEQPGDSVDFIVPTIEWEAPPAEGSLFDYMGIPPNIPFNDSSVNALHLRAYMHIFNNWFRDQNLTNDQFFPKDDGPDASELYVLQGRRKRPDYFTSCLPFAQKGDPVTLNIGGDAPIQVTTTDGTSDSITLQVFPGGTFADMDTAGPTLEVGTGQADGLPLTANLSEATGITINDLRQSFQVQKLLERDARGGTRYPER